LCGITASPPNSELRKTALGAEESVAWKYFNSTIEALTNLKEEGYSIIAVEQTSSSLILNNFTPKSGVKYALILGNEVHGVSEDCLPLCDNYLEIPQSGSKHSLNVAVSAGIVSWHFFQHLYKMKNPPASGGF
jgi:23S rRNA (guanosine2251-2'-O)-methyltransferase